MPNDIEPIPRKRRVATLRTARELGIPVILSYKPVVKGWNDSEDQIGEVMSLAREFADAIIVGGLRVDNAIASAIRAAGREVPVEVPARWGEKALDVETYERIGSLRERIAPEVPLYNHTSCAVSLCMEIPNYNDLRRRDPDACTVSCPIAQIGRCTGG